MTIDKSTNVFVLTDEKGRLLPPSIQTTVLAKYSRSPLSAKNIVMNLSSEEADKFNDKWVISYSHSSVSELATIPICYEGISIIASKFLESFQRASYSEKSTRYQVFTKDSFINPVGCEDLSDKCQKLYSAYEKIIGPLTEKISKITEKPSDSAITKARAFDNVRYLLPAGTGTNLAVVANIRDFRYLIQQAMGHTNKEIKKIGELTKKSLEEICPVFVKNLVPDTQLHWSKSVGDPISFDIAREGKIKQSVKIIEDLTDKSSIEDAFNNKLWI
jgi:thymidylate synthase ThyX